MAGIRIEDHTNEVLAVLAKNVQAGLEACGNQAVSHAKSNITASGRVDTGALRNSMNHLVEGDTCSVGTNQEYAVYNEMGTGIYVGGGRQSPWAYKDSKGQWHRTRGMAGIHFLKNAIADHIEEYRQILSRFIKGG